MERLGEFLPGRIGPKKVGLGKVVKVLIGFNPWGYYFGGKVGAFHWGPKVVQGLIRFPGRRRKFLIGLKIRLGLVVMG